MLIELLPEPEALGLLKRIGYAWRRARLALCIRDPRKPERMAAIERALGRASRRDTAVLYGR